MLNTVQLHALVFYALDLYALDFWWWNIFVTSSMAGNYSSSDSSVSNLENFMERYGNNHQDDDKYQWIDSH